jgi:hypothetical protein
MTIHTILDDAEADDAAKAVRAMASTVADDESLSDRIRHKAKEILSKAHDELVADITKARIIKAEAYDDLTKHVAAHLLGGGPGPAARTSFSRANHVNVTNLTFRAGPL